MDDKTELHRFAEMLMRWVRDPSIDSCDALVSRRMFGPTGERWRDQLAEPQAREAMSQLIPDIVDEVLFKLLHALDQGDMPLAWRRENGTYVDLYDLGRSEMAGWLVGTDPACWRARYSSKRWWST
jgi:hypothetical protein